MVGGAALGTLGERLLPAATSTEAWAGTPIGPTDGILVVDHAVRRQRRAEHRRAVRRRHVLHAARRTSPSRRTRCCAIDGQVGLHPELTYLKSLYDAGQVAIVQGVGYPNPDLSHFTSMGIWMNGRFGGGRADERLDRSLARRARRPHVADLAAATRSTRRCRCTCWAQPRRAVGISAERRHVRRRRPNRRTSACTTASGRWPAPPAGRGPWHDMFAATMRTPARPRRRRGAGVRRSRCPDGDDRPQAHRRGPPDQREHRPPGARRRRSAASTPTTTRARRHRAICSASSTPGCRRSSRRWRPQFRDRVTLMTMSEFGRTLVRRTTRAAPTTAPPAPHVRHRRAACGRAVRAGAVARRRSTAVGSDGARTSTSARCSAPCSTAGWAAAAAPSSNGGFENLGLFAGGPGRRRRRCAVSCCRRHRRAASWPLTPLPRVRHPRRHRRSRRRRSAPGETWTFALAGQFGIPADGGRGGAEPHVGRTPRRRRSSRCGRAAQPRPFASNLNPVPGMAVPNLVRRPARRRRCDRRSSTTPASVHLVADVVGYFDASERRRPRAAARRHGLLDTRDGTGDRLGAVGPGESIDLQVTGRGGVPAERARRWR